MTGGRYPARPGRSTVTRVTYYNRPMTRVESFVERAVTLDPTLPMADRAGAAPAPGDRLGRYVVERQLGRGGMGLVVAAHDPELDRRIAIKLVQPRLWQGASEDARELLRREAQAMARLSHPNVVAVHDVGTFGDQLFVAMELVDGVTLDVWLRGGRSRAAVLAVCHQAGVGLAAAHRAGLVHRDVK